MYHSQYNKLSQVTYRDIQQGPGSLAKIFGNSFCGISKSDRQWYYGNQVPNKDKQCRSLSNRQEDGDSRKREAE